MDRPPPAPQEMSLQDLGRAAAITLAAAEAQQRAAAAAPPPAPRIVLPPIIVPDCSSPPHPCAALPTQLSILQEAAAAACLAEGMGADESRPASPLPLRRAPAAAGGGTSGGDRTPAPPARKRQARAREAEVVVLDPSTLPPALQQSLCFTATAPGGQPLFLVDRHGRPVQVARPPPLTAVAAAAVPAPMPAQQQVQQVHMAYPWVGAAAPAAAPGGAAPGGAPSRASNGTAPPFVPPYGKISLEQVQPVRRNTRTRTSATAAAPQAAAARPRRREEETVAQLEDGRKIVRGKKHERSRSAVFRGRITTLFKMASEIETITSAKYLMVIVDKETGDVFLRSSKELKNVLQESSAIHDIVTVSRQLRERAAALRSLDPDAKMEPTQFYRAQHQQNQRAASNKSVQVPMSPRAAGIKRNKPRKGAAAAAAAAESDDDDDDDDDDVRPAAAAAAAAATESSTEEEEEHSERSATEDDDDEDDGEKTEDEVQPMDLSSWETAHRDP